MQLFNNNPTTPSLEPVLQVPTPTTIPSPIAETAQNNNSISAQDLIKGIQWWWSTNNFVVNAWSSTKEWNAVSTAQEVRFLSVKYKVYSFIVIVIILFVASPIQTALQNTRDKRELLQATNTKINTVIDNQKRYEDEKKLFENIQQHKEVIIACINQSSRCDQLPENISENIEPVKAYMQLWNLRREKMEVDEAKILKSINEYMLQKNILWWKRLYNWTVTSISIGWSKEVENNIIKVPVSLLISFDKKEDLLSFLSNIENYIFTDEKDWLDSAILFRIETLQYDIVNYKESQDVEVSLSAYAYNWK